MEGLALVELTDCLELCVGELLAQYLINAELLTTGQGRTLLDVQHPILSKIPALELSFPDYANSKLFIDSESIRADISIQGGTGIHAFGAAIEVTLVGAIRDKDNDEQDDDMSSLNIQTHSLTNQGLRERDDSTRVMIPTGYTNRIQKRVREYSKS